MRYLCYHEAKAMRAAEHELAPVGWGVIAVQ